MSKAEDSPARDGGDMVQAWGPTHPEMKASAAANQSGAPMMEIILSKQQEGLGVEIDVVANGIQVTRIGRGAVRKYNQAAKEEERIQANDLIVMVNGASDPREMAQRIFDDESVTLRVIRLVRKVVTIDKNGDQLGLTLLFHEIASSCLYVKEIAAGAVETHNNKAAKEDLVFPKDFSESVNGKIGKGAELLRELRDSNKVELVLLRIPGA